MRGIAIALSTLMFGTGVMSFASAPPATIQDYSAISAPIATIPSGTLQFAGSFRSSPDRLKDKYLASPARERKSPAG